MLKTAVITPLQVLTKMLCHFQDEPGITASHFQGVQDGREAFIELDIDNGSDDSNNTPIGGGSSSCRCNIVSACKIMQRMCASDAAIEVNAFNFLPCSSAKEYRIWGLTGHV